MSTCEFVQFLIEENVTLHGYIYQIVNLWVRKRGVENVLHGISSN